jgi:uncharacterized protein YdeI (YjbR/CyaY-like superfamily)
MMPGYFRSPAEFRRWLEKNHRSARELLVGYYKKDTGKPSLTWPESVAEALCFGWIDGIRRSVDAQRYTIRFTPRRTRSTWSAINIRLMKELEAAGKMTDAGRAAFAARMPEKSRIYTYEQRKEVRLAPTLVKRFKKHRSAWTFFTTQAPSYQKKAVTWVMNAKTPATRESRFARLLASAAAGKR